MFQTEADEEVIFVSEKSAPKSKEITVDKVKRLALQRDIDQQSQPRKPATPLISQCSGAVEGGDMKKVPEGRASVPEQKHVSVDEGSQAEVKIEKKSKKVDVIVIDVDGESLDESGEQKEKKKRRKKRKIVTESLNDSCVKNGNDKEVKKKKKKEVAQLSSVEEKPMKVNKTKDESVQMKPQRVKLVKEQEDELPKRVKKRKSISVVNTEKHEEQVKEKKRKTSAGEGITTTKKIKSAKVKVSEKGVKLGAAERDTNAEDQNKLSTPQTKGNGRRSKAASGQKVEKEDLPNKKKDKSTKSEIVIIDEEETEIKTNAKKEKRRRAAVEVSRVEEKKRKKGNSMEGEGEALILNCEEVEQQSSETGAVDTTGKKKKVKKKKVEAVSLGTGAKKRKIKEEVEDQHESNLVDVVFLSEKTGNTDEVTINQERRQALQMEIDEASQPKTTDKPTGLGQWGTAQFDSSEQQQKFLRLMGGFKKSSQPAAGSADRASMALGKDAQRQLQQGLLGDFERAQSRRMDFSNRGSGLGFSAPANKKVSIDINARRSVRFDD